MKGNSDAGWPTRPNYGQAGCGQSKHADRWSWDCLYTPNVLPASPGFHCECGSLLVSRLLMSWPQETQRRTLYISATVPLEPPCLCHGTPNRMRSGSRVEVACILSLPSAGGIRAWLALPSKSVPIEFTSLLPNHELVTHYMSYCRSSASRPRSARVSGSELASSSGATGRCKWKANLAPWPILPGNFQ
jgi:hypothetical protein